MPDGRASRYDTLVATFVGVCALLVSAYTAYIQAATRWRDVLIALAGPEKVGFWQSTFAGRTVSPGESIDVLVPWGASGPLKLADHDPLYDKLNDARFKVSVEICYCSTLGDCWTLKAGNSDSVTTAETHRCPAKSGTTFLQ